MNSGPLPSLSPPASKQAVLAPAAVVRSLWVRWLLRVFALSCLVLAVIGAVVPGLPTTVFVLMAGWAAMRSSPRLHGWLWRHALFGPMLQNWAAGGCVSRAAKRSAGATMVLCGVVLWSLSYPPMWVRVVATVCMLVVLCWLWHRPEPAAQPAQPEPDTVHE